MATLSFKSENNASKSLVSGSLFTYLKKLSIEFLSKKLITLLSFSNIACVKEQ